MFHADALTTPARTLPPNPFSHLPRECRPTGPETSWISTDNYDLCFTRRLGFAIAFEGEVAVGMESRITDEVYKITVVTKEGGKVKQHDVFRTFADFLNHPASVLVPDAFLTSASVVLPVAGMPSDAFICIFAGDADCKHKLFYVRVDRGPDRRDVVTHVRLGANALCRLLQQAADLERIERAMNVNLPDNEDELKIVDERIAALEDLIDDWIK